MVQVGKGGVTDSVLFSLREALAARELVKIKVLKNAAEEPKEVGPVLAEATQASLVQVVGRNVVLYKAKEKEPVIVLP